MAETVKHFITQTYRLINPSNPTVPLHGNDLQQGIEILNELMDSYSATGLMMTIAKEVNIPLMIGEGIIVVGPSTFVPLPQISLGRLANIEEAWLELSGVTYPLIPKSRDEFNASFKYNPLKGLPRFIITYPDTEVVRLRIYPAPSEFFRFFLRAKFQLPQVASTDTMSALPGYYIRYLKFATARDLALYKGRADAWTDKLEMTYKEAKDIMEAASEVNLSITGDRASLLNGAYRVRAGI